VDGIVFERLANGNHFAGLRYVRADNTIGRNGGQVGSDREFVTFTPQYTLTWDHPTAVPFPNPEVPVVVPDGYVVPQIEPSVPDAPEPLPLPLPSPVTVPPAVPEVQPVPQPTRPNTQTIRIPQIVKTTTIVRQPEQQQTAIVIVNGSQVAPAPAPVTQTDPTQIIPWPGADPIVGPGPAPAPTLEGIAGELGRIERKLEVMNTPAAPGNLVDKIGDIGDLIGPIVEAIMALTSETTYQLDSPCEVNEVTGEKLPPVLVQVPGAITQFGAILNRIDALAELLQVHKNLKQPNCKTKPPTGEFVTVNFEQID